MISLIQFLKEADERLAPEEKKIEDTLSTPEEKEQYEKALAILHQDDTGTLEEGLKDVLKKLGLTATVIAALMSTPTVSSAQKADLKSLRPAVTQTVGKDQGQTSAYEEDIKKVQTTIKAYRQYTIGVWKLGVDQAHKLGYTGIEIGMHGIGGPNEDPTNEQSRQLVDTGYMKWALGTGVDGVNGRYTSQFKFPNAFIVDYQKKSIVKDLGKEGNDALLLIAKGGLTIEQMNQWNDFVDWMKSKGYSGKEDMDHFTVSIGVIKEYKSTPQGKNFWIHTPE